MLFADSEPSSRSELPASIEPNVLVWLGPGIYSSKSSLAEATLEEMVTGTIYSMTNNGAFEVSSSADSASLVPLPLI